MCEGSSVPIVESFMQKSISLDYTLTNVQKNKRGTIHADCAAPYSRRGLVVRIAYLLCAIVYTVLTGLGRFCRNGVIVLCYHGISGKQRERFAWQMSKIRSRAVNFAECAAGRRPYVSVTFDDAFANLLDNALPVLERYQVPTVVFAVADNLGCLPHWEMPDRHPESAEITMTPGQLMVISKNPLFRIGSHTLTHPDLTKIRPEQLKTELSNSKHWLEQLLGKPIEDLALPFGSYNQEVLSVAQEVGYKRIYTLEPRPANPMFGEQMVGRFSMSPNVWKIEFLLTCIGAYTWLYSWRRFVCFIRQRIVPILDR